MTATRSVVSRSSLGVLMAALFAFSSCSAQPATNAQGDDASTAPSVSPTQSASEELVAEIDEPVEFEACQEAEQLEGATVEWLDDVVVEEQRIEGTEAQTVEIEGQEVEIPGAPDIVVPERVAQAGCIIEYPAPGGCLPAVEISEAVIPGYRIPERRLEGLELPDGTVLDEVIQEELKVDAVRQDGVREEQVCQTEPEAAENDQIVHSIMRHSIMRHSFISLSEMQEYVARDSQTSESGKHLNVMALQHYSTKFQTIPAAHVPHAVLESYVVEGTKQTEFAERDEITAYTTEGDVLFDSDDHQLRNDAESELQAIAEDIASRGDEVTIRVEGHTDNLPTQKYADNTELSQRRAESVVQWLTDNAELTAAELSAEGLGDAHPRASNSSEEGRQQNRRVVITVTPKDYEPSIEYELDDANAPTN